MADRAVTIRNSLGLHARPAAQLVRIAAGFRSVIELERDGMSVNAKSIMGVMMLAAEQGAVLTLRAEGDDADAAVAAIAELIEAGFGE